MKKFLLYLFLIVSVEQVSSQVWQGGMHFGYNINRFTLPENQVSDDLFLTQGSLFQGGEVGMQLYISKYRDQPSVYFKPTANALLEVSFSYMGGNLGATTTLEDGVKRYSEITYYRFMGMYSPKFVLGLKKFQILVGPVIMNSFMDRATTLSTDEPKSAKPQFETYSIGYDLGIGVKSGPLMFNAKLTGNLTDFGSGSEEIPGKFNFMQVRFFVHFFFIQKEKGKYWDSIYFKD